MWMTHLYNNYLHNRPLSAITLPGTHDSGCYVDSMLAGRMAKTQVADMAGQLAGGIRYFDLRPAEARGGTYWTYHGKPYWGDSFDNILAALRAYLAGNVAANRELVILNISHFSGTWSVKQHVAFIKYLGENLAEWLVQHNQNHPIAANNINLFGAPYAQVLTTPANGTLGSRVAILYDGAMDQPRSDFLANPNLVLPRGFFLINKYPIAMAANRICLFDQYSNKSSMAEMRTVQHAKLTQRGNPDIAPAQLGVNYAANAAGGVANTLHLLSWTCTYWGQSAITSIIDRAAADVNPGLPNYLQQNNWGWAGAPGVRPYHPELDPKINIIYTDHFASAATALAPGHVDQYLNALGAPVALAMPVALAAKLNKYGGVGPLAWTGWAGW